METVPWRVILLVIAFVVLGHGVRAEQEYEMTIEKLERMNDNGEYFTYNYTYDKLTEMKYSVSANVHQHKELDSSFSVKALMARADLAEGSEFEVMLDLQKPLCEWMTTIYKTYFYEELEKVSNFPHYDTCPLPPAEYWVKEYVFDYEPYKDMMSEGRWKVEMMLLKGDVVCSGILMINTVKLKT
ncbi:uncharacterized protein LOC131284889 [Anopheles ziemanni]|uniref:uncharacterized protein LOC131262152 n=1 Tax=Anopheles coustani TaxID=139045 RepID=UPI002657D621|nr:uncharacterized protein LOC131262152 [Anopheles coustani]XP_058169731.1 uncharacterized protein LOC131284889 [Anopheles ziemanni]